jgi:hypothetical protein
MIVLFQFVSSLVCLGPAHWLVQVLELQEVLTRSQIAPDAQVVAAAAAAAAATIKVDPGCGVHIRKAGCRRFRLGEG